MMVEKYKIRTDLAMEQKERIESDHVEVSGVVLEEEYDEEKEMIKNEINKKSNDVRSIMLKYCVSRMSK